LTEKSVAIISKQSRKSKFYIGAFCPNGGEAFQQQIEKHVNNLVFDTNTYEVFISTGSKGIEPAKIHMQQQNV